MLLCYFESGFGVYLGRANVESQLGSLGYDLGSGVGFRARARARFGFRLSFWFEEKKIRFD